MTYVILRAPEPIQTIVGLGQMLSNGWALTHRSLAHWVRSPGSVISSLAFSIVILLTFGTLFGGAIIVPVQGSYHDLLMTGKFVTIMVLSISFISVAAGLNGLPIQCGCGAVDNAGLGAVAEWNTRSFTATATGELFSNPSAGGDS